MAEAEEEKKKTSVGKIILFVAGGGCLMVLLVMGGCTLIFGKAVHDVGQAKQQEAERAKAAPVSNLRWVEINSIYNLKSRYSDLQKKEKWKKYKGQKVKWTGWVSSVSDTFGTLTLQVKMNRSTFTSDVLLRLRDSEKEKALRLNKGNSVTFIGILDDWGSLMPITLEQVEIVTN